MPSEHDKGRSAGLLAEGIAEVCGKDSEVYRDLFRALQTDDDVDLMLAQASFDALPGDKRRRIYAIVEELAEELRNSESATG